MNLATIDGKTYGMDSSGFLVRFEQWDEGFAEWHAPTVGIAGPLGERHWEVIRFIRDFFVEHGYCPLVYQTCRGCRLRLRELRALFPAGYLRGACKLAGISYRHGTLQFLLDGGPASEMRERHLAAAAGEAPAPGRESYVIDSRGFLVDPATWDEQYAAFRAAEMMLARLTPEHWRVLRYLRRHHGEHGEVPTVYQTCEDNNLELEDLEKLFPHGYHRGAVKLAGLHVV